MAAAGLHRLSFALSLKRQVLLHGFLRLQPGSHRFTTRVPRMAFHVRAGASKGNAAEEFHNKVHDNDLIKTAGYINGQWVAATDGSTIEASPTAYSTCAGITASLCAKSLAVISTVLSA